MKCALAVKEGNDKVGYVTNNLKICNLEDCDSANYKFDTVPIAILAAYLMQKINPRIMLEFEELSEEDE